MDIEFYFTTITTLHYLSFNSLQQFVLLYSLSFTCHCMTYNHYLNHYQNPVDTYFVFIRWSNLYIFQTSIASISSSFVGEGVVL